MSQSQQSPARQGARPRLPEAGRSGGEGFAELRRFHLGAPSPGAAADGETEIERVGEGLLPALLHPFRGVSPVRSDYPLFLAPAETEESLCLAFPAFLERVLRALEGEGRPAGSLLRDNLRRLERHAAELAAGVGGAAEARALLAEAGAAMIAELALPAADRDALTADLDRVVAAVPEGGRLLGATPAVPLVLARHAVLARQRGVRAAFAREARDLAARAEAILEADRLNDPASRGAESLESSMGRPGGRHFDPAALAGVLGPRRGSERLGPKRRKRLAASLETLRRASRQLERPAVTVAHDGSVAWAAGLSRDGLRPAEGRTDDGEGEGTWSDWVSLESSDPCRLAAEVFDREAEKVVEVLRAVRRVRFETEGGLDLDGDSERRDALEDQLASLDWQALAREELALLPPVLAVESADEIAARGMMSLSQLLLSGRPVQVLIELDPADDPGAEEPLAGFRFEPAFLGVSLREAFVAQCSLSVPLGLAAALARAAGGTRSGLHVIAGAGGALRPDLDPAVAAGAAVDSRAHPLFAYDPEAGLSWAERLRFDDNPEPAEDWPVHGLEVAGAGGAPESLSLAFTFADFALLSKALAGAFRPVPDSLAADGLVSVTDWLALPPEKALEAVPFVWAVDGAGRMVRLVLSRPLALACRDRLAFWRTLQELAGVKSEYVRRARAGIEEDAAARIAAERERLEAAHAVELERVRREAAEEVADRLTAALLGVDPGLFASSAPGSAPLAALAGRDVEEVSAALLEALSGDGSGGDPERSPEANAPPPSEGAVARVAAELLSLIDVDPDHDGQEERRDEGDAARSPEP